MSTPYIYHEVQDGPMAGMEVKVYIEDYIYEAPEPEVGFLGGLDFECDNLRVVVELGNREFEPHHFNYFPFLDKLIDSEYDRLAEALREWNEDEEASYWSAVEDDRMERLRGL